VPVVWRNCLRVKCMTFDSEIRAGKASPIELLTLIRRKSDTFRKVL
jgi:hypothetical protein